MKDSDKRDKLLKNPFGYIITKSQRILIYRDHKLIKTLRGKETFKLLAGIAGKNDHEIQLQLAKITGNFKHGNEKR